MVLKHSALRLLLQSVTEKQSRTPKEDRHSIVLQSLQKDLENLIGQNSDFQVEPILLDINGDKVVF